jgi:capsule polysaccharide export protein KpsE/RkpR
MSVSTELLQRDPELDTAPEAEGAAVSTPNWIANAFILLQHRRILMRVAAIALLLNLAVAFLIPKRYESTARIMPPESSGSGTALLSALAGRALGGELLGGLAASLLGGHNSGALFIDLLRSGTVTGKLIDRFQLQSVYHKRYVVDASKVLARRTKIDMDKKSGVITITVTDTSPQRARDLTQAYLDELNLIVNRTSTSSARRERMFIQSRLAAVRTELDNAQDALSNFSSKNMTVDLREQTRATVDAAAKLEGELIATQGELTSLREIYGDENVRVKAAEARAANLRMELGKIGGSSAVVPADSADGKDSSASTGSADDLTYPPLRQLPRLAVPYANLYRTVRVQETVFELLTQQFEIAQIQEAKDVPVLSVIDSPGVPEKKSFPPRAILTIALTLLDLLLVSAFLVFRAHWRQLEQSDPRRLLAHETADALREAWQRTTRGGGNVG